MILFGSTNERGKYVLFGSTNERGKYVLFESTNGRGKYMLFGSTNERGQYMLFGRSYSNVKLRYLTYVSRYLCSTVPLVDDTLPGFHTVA